MIVNKKIKETLEEIAKENIKYLNTPDKEHKYLKRLLNIYKNNLSEDEQIFVFKFILEHMHYRSIITDPDNVIQIYNVKLKTITYIFILFILGVIIVAFIFNFDNKVTELLSTMNKILRLVSI